MSRNSLSDVQNCIHNQGKSGAKVGCASLPVYVCDLHNRCVHKRSCRTGNLKICVDCIDMKLPENPPQEQ